MKRLCTYNFYGDKLNTKYCSCWMGSSRSGDTGPNKTDPFGSCPGNPKLKDTIK